MRKAMKTAIVTIGVVGLLGAAPSALANDRDVERTGSCSGRSDWKLKLSPEDGRLEVEFEVDQNVVGDRWRVTISHEGDRIFRGVRETRGPSGSFEVRTLANNTAGSDSFKAKARNLSTDETCVGRASI
jgi:hypothetical protein